MRESFCHANSAAARSKNEVSNGESFSDIPANFLRYKSSSPAKTVFIKSSKTSLAIATYVKLSVELRSGSKTWTSLGLDMYRKFLEKYLSLPPEINIPPPFLTQNTSTKSWRCNPTECALSDFPWTTLKYLLPCRWESCVNSVTILPIHNPSFSWELTAAISQSPPAVGKNFIFFFNSQYNTNALPDFYISENRNFNPWEARAALPADTFAKLTSASSAKLATRKPHAPCAKVHNKKIACLFAGEIRL